jgi:hypothetical protein
VVPQRTCKDYQEYQDDVKSLKEQGFQWIGSKGPAAAHYEPNTHHREGFTISSHDGSQRW